MHRNVQEQDKQEQNEQNHEMAVRTKFGIFTEKKAIPPEDKKLLQNADKILTQLGSPLADNLKVTKLQGHDMKKVDEYTAVRRPGCSKSDF